MDDEEAAQILAAVEANGDGAEVHEYWRCDCQQLFLSENALKKHQHEEHGVPIGIDKVRTAILIFERVKWCYMTDLYTRTSMVFYFLLSEPLPNTHLIYGIWLLMKIFNKKEILNSMIMWKVFSGSFL